VGQEQVREDSPVMKPECCAYVAHPARSAPRAAAGTKLARGPSRLRRLLEEMSLTGDLSRCNVLTTGHAQDQVYKDQQTQGVSVLLETKIVCGSRKGTIQKSRLPATYD